MQKTLKKILDELNADSPRLDYIKGMLEVLIEDEQPSSTVTVHGVLVASDTGTKAISKESDEGSMIDAAAKAKLASVRDMAQSSAE